MNTRKFIAVDTMARIYFIADGVATVLAILLFVNGQYWNAAIVWLFSEVWAIRRKMLKG